LDSAYVAAYHPWLQVARSDDARDALVMIPPSAAAPALSRRGEFVAARTDGAGKCDCPRSRQACRHDKPC